MSGLFSVNESKDKVTFASKIHGAGSAFGFMALMFFPFLSWVIRRNLKELFLLMKVSGKD